MTTNPVEKICMAEITPELAAEMLAVLRKIRNAATLVHARGAVIVEAPVMQRVRGVLAAAGEIGGAK